MKNPFPENPDLALPAKEIWKSLAFYGSHERAKPLVEILRGLPPELFWRVFYENWQTCDAISGFSRDFEAVLIAANKRVRFRRHCSSEVSAWYDQLPNPIPVFRGCTVMALRGLSWTTDRTIAAEFARGHRGIPVYMPVIAQAEISKRSVLAAFTSEKEIVVKPLLLKNFEMEILFTQDKLFSDPWPKATS